MSDYDEDEYDDGGGWGGFDFGPTPAGPGGSGEEAAGDKLTNTELLNLGLDQILHPEFVMKQTRGEKLVDHSNIHDDLEDEDEGEARGDSSKLMSTVLQESRVEHLTAGFSTAKPTLHTGEEAVGDKNAAVMGRLSRELAAQAYSAAGFQGLANRRSHILNVLFAAFGEDSQNDNVNKLIKKKYGKGTSLLNKNAIMSAVSILLRMIKETSRNNPDLCMEILSDLQQLINGIPTMAFSANSIPGAYAEIAQNAFDSIHQFLTMIASDPRTSSVIRGRCVELVLGLAVSCSSLSYFLSVMKLLLFPVSSTKSIGVLPLLHKLEQLRREVFLEQPSPLTQDARTSVTELADQAEISVATDGTYLYTHSRAGLCKIGTGKNGSTPGLIYGQIKGYRSYDTSSLACIGDKLYYRSSQTAPSILIVLDCKYLTEVGNVLASGKGSYASANNTHIDFGVKADKNTSVVTSVTLALDEENEDKKEGKEGKGEAEATKDKKELSDAERMKAKHKEAEGDDQKGPPTEDKKAETKSKHPTPDQPDQKAQNETKQGPGGPAVPSGPGGAPGTGTPATGGTPGTVDPNAPPTDPNAPANPNAPTTATVTTEVESGSKVKKAGNIPLISCGRFLYTVLPEKKKIPVEGSKPSDRVELSVHVFDPLAEKRLEHFHSVTLRGAPPKPRMILSMARAQDKKSSKSDKKGAGASAAVYSRGGRRVATKSSSRVSWRKVCRQAGQPCSPQL